MRRSKLSVRRSAESRRRVIFAVVCGMFTLWGTVAAAALFMARFDLWTGEPGETASEEWTAPVHAVVYGATLDAVTWPRVIAPDSAVRVAEQLPVVRGMADAAGYAQAAVRQHVQMCWNPDDSRGAWVVELRWPDCACPADAVARWNVLIAIVDPLTARPIDARLFTSVTREEPLAVRFAEMPETAWHAGGRALPIIIHDAREGGDANLPTTAPEHR